MAPVLAVSPYGCHESATAMTTTRIMTRRSVIAQTERSGTAAHLAPPAIDLGSSSEEEAGKSPKRSRHGGSKVRRDCERAKRLGFLIKPSGLRSGGVQFVGHEVAKCDQPTGLTYFSGLLAQCEEEAILALVNKTPQDKRSPWSTEGFGGSYQKVYFIREKQVDMIRSHGYPWNKRRMEHQTVYDPEDSEDPGSVLLIPNIYAGHPFETLTERISRLCPRKPGKTVQLLALQANWMRGSDFPTHKDQPDKEGWGDIIAALSLGSGGHLVIKDPVIEEAWTMHIESGDAYYMKDAIRWEWEHGMVADNADLRISLVWRFQEVDA